MSILERLKSKYGTSTSSDGIELRMLNTKIFRILARTRTLGLLNGITLVNSRGDTIKILLENEVVNVYLCFDNDYINVSKFIFGSNKYGSSIIKRFFKDFHYEFITTSITFVKNRVLENFDELYHYKYTATYTNLQGDILKIREHKTAIETTDSGNARVIVNNPNMDRVIKFFMDLVY